MYKPKNGYSEHDTNYLSSAIIDTIKAYMSKIFVKKYKLKGIKKNETYTRRNKSKKTTRKWF